MNLRESSSNELIIEKKNKVLYQQEIEHAHFDIFGNNLDDIQKTFSKLQISDDDEENEENYKEIDENSEYNCNEKENSIPYGHYLFTSTKTPYKLRNLSKNDSFSNSIGRPTPRSPLCDITPSTEKKKVNVKIQPVYFYIYIIYSMILLF